MYGVRCWILDRLHGHLKKELSTGGVVLKSDLICDARVQDVGKQESFQDGSVPIAQHAETSQAIPRASSN